MAIKRRPIEDEDKAIELAVEGKTLVDIAKILGFTSKYAFTNYRHKFEDFNQRLDHARSDYCDDLEDQLLTIPMELDCKTAQILSNNIIKILEYRNPKRYSPKYQHEIQVTVDISGSLDRAERRVQATVSNVIEIQAANAKQIQNESDD